MFIEVLLGDFNVDIVYRNQKHRGCFDQAEMRLSGFVTNMHNLYTASKISALFDCLLYLMYSLI